MTAIKLTEIEKKVLEVLAEDYDSSGWDETGFWSFDPLEKKTGIERRKVRLACRSLARKGFAKYMRGLVNLDGEMAGAGYGATEQGAALITPCDICGKLAHYDYPVNEKGEADHFGKDTRRVLECEEHYKKSAEQKKLL